MNKQHSFRGGVRNKKTFAYRGHRVRVCTLLHRQFALTLVFLARLDICACCLTVQLRERTYGEIQRMRLTGTGSADKSHEKNRALIPFPFEPGEMGIAGTQPDSHKHSPCQIIHRVTVTLIRLPHDTLNLHRHGTQREIAAFNLHAHVNGLAEHEHRVDRLSHRLSSVNGFGARAATDFGFHLGKRKN